MIGTHTIGARLGRSPTRRRTIARPHLSERRGSYPLNLAKSSQSAAAPELPWGNQSPLQQRIGRRLWRLLGGKQAGRFHDLMSEFHQSCGTVGRDMADIFDMR